MKIPSVPKWKPRFRALAALLAFSALLSGCASAPRFPAGEALLRGETPRLPRAPDSLRCGLELTAFVGGRKSSVSAAFSARPRGAYKLDLFGLPGMVAGSFLWARAHWTLVLFDRDAYLEGAGERVELGELGLRDVSVHDLFSFLWGDFCPGGPARQDSAGSGMAGLPADWKALGNGSFGYSAQGVGWRVNLDGKTGLPREALRQDSALRIAYSEYKPAPPGSGTAGGAGGMPVPGRVRFYRYRDQVLEIKVKSLENDPRWRRDPFFIKVPKGFARLERVGEAR